MTTQSTTFHERLIKLIDERGVRKTAIAEAAGVSPTMVTRWVKGQSVPSIAQLAAVCEQLRATAEEHDALFDAAARVGR